MKCPIDGATLVISDRSGVEIDYCPECRGVWLDRGELDKIIERAAVVAPPPPPQTPRDTRYKDDRYYDDGYDRRPRKKRESFLSDLFDF